MQTESLSTIRFVEIACDESGSEGENLVGGNTDVFAHASVRLDTESATNCVQEIRSRIRSPALEYKANHLLREKHRSVLRWLLGPSGPIHGHAHVQLTDKAFFVVGRVIDLLVGEADEAISIGPAQDQHAKDMAVTLYREGQPALGREQWQAFLESASDLMRTRNRLGVRASVDPFVRMVDVLRPMSTRGRVGEVIGLLRQARPHAASFRAQLVGNPRMIPVLDLLIPAIVQAVTYWGEGGKPVAIVHDEHVSLTEDRIAQLKEIVNKAHRGRLTSLRLVDSRLDSRVQIADFLAGVARKIASDELNRRGDAELTGLLRPYVDSLSIWGDDRSWSVLGPAPSTRS